MNLDEYKIKKATSIEELATICRGINIVANEYHILQKMDSMLVTYSREFVDVVVHGLKNTDPSTEFSTNAVAALYNIIRAYVGKLDHIPSEKYYYDDVICLMCSDRTSTAFTQDTYAKFYGYILDEYVADPNPDELIKIAVDNDIYHTLYIDEQTVSELSKSYDIDLTNIYVLVRHVQRIKDNSSSSYDELRLIAITATTDAFYNTNLEKITNMLKNKIDPLLLSYTIGTIQYAFNMAIVLPYYYPFIAPLVDIREQLDSAGVEPQYLFTLGRLVRETLIPYQRSAPEHLDEKWNKFLSIFGPESYDRGIDANKIITMKSEWERYHEKMNAINAPATEATRPPVNYRSSKVVVRKPSTRGNASKSAGYAIHKGYEAFKDNAAKVEAGVNKMVAAGKKMLIGDVKTEIVEGKKFTLLGMIKKCLRTSAIFSIGPVKGLIALLVTKCMRASTKKSERRAIAQEISIELQMLDEKIDDARGDGDRDAKYAMMRTRAELNLALDKIKFGMEATPSATKTAKSVLRNRGV